MLAPVTAYFSNNLGIDKEANVWYNIGVEAMSLKEEQMNTQSAKKVQEFTTIIKRDVDGCARVLTMPGHNMRQYQVTLSRTNGTMVASCQTDAGAWCKGNTGHICYHVLAAIMKAAENKGCRVIFPRSGVKGDAGRLVNLHNGARLLHIKSSQSTSEGWGIVITPKSEPEPDLVVASNDHFKVNEAEHLEKCKNYLVLYNAGIFNSVAMKELKRYFALLNMNHSAIVVTVQRARAAEVLRGSEADQEGI